MSFWNDLREAESLEDLVINRYEQYGFQVNTNRGIRFSEYDLQVIKDDTTENIEIKFDKKASLTNNLCCEFKNTRTNNLSGICAGRREDSIIYFFESNGLLSYIKTIKGDLIDYCREYSFKTIKSFEGNSLCWLIKIDSKFKEIFNIKPSPITLN